jgi:hypothetical protein
MRQFLTVVLIIAAVGAAIKFLNFARTEVDKGNQRDTGAPAAPGRLAGLPPELEASLADARRAGADGLRRWLQQHRRDVGEPRLTEIELDFVVLAGRTSAAEARRTLNQIKPRITPDHPLARRFQQLDQAYP